MTKAACENSTISLECPKDRYIFINSLRVTLNSEKCQFKSSKVRCTKEVYVEKSKFIADRCKNHQKCDVVVNRNSFGLECTGDSRYLSISHTCSKYPIDKNNQFIIPKKKDKPKIKPRNDIQASEEAKKLIVESKNFVKYL